MLDSGCTRHITNSIADFATFTEYTTPGYATLADTARTRMATLSVGSVHATTTVNGQTVQLELHDVLYAPESADRLISILRLDHKGFDTVFGSRRASILKNGGLYGVGTIREDHYWLGLKSKSAGIHATSSSTHGKPATIDTMHQRFGHLNWEAIRKLSAKESLVKGLEFNSSLQPSLHPCEGCVFGKQHRRSFPSSSTPRATEPFELVHSDLDGPMQVQSVTSHARYFVTFIDDYSDTVFVYYLKSKDEQTLAFDTFSAMVETQFKTKIRRFRSDRGGKYQSNAFTAKLRKMEIQHQCTVPDTPQQNGKAERMNRTLVEAANSMLQAAGMSPGFWEEAVRTAVHVRNRAPKKALKWRTPVEVLTGSKPNVDYFCVFGCLAHRLIQGDKRKKFDPHSEACVLVGYDTDSKGYRLWSKSSRKLISSTDVIFDESVFPYRSPPPTPSSSSRKPEAEPQPSQPSSLVTTTLEFPDMPAPAATPAPQAPTRPPTPQAPPPTTSAPVPPTPSISTPSTPQASPAPLPSAKALEKRPQKPDPRIQESPKVTPNPNRGRRDDLTGAYLPFSSPITPEQLAIPPAPRRNPSRTRVNSHAALPHITESAFQRKLAPEPKKVSKSKGKARASKYHKPDDANVNVIIHAVSVHSEPQTSDVQTGSGFSTLGRMVESDGGRIQRSHHSGHMGALRSSQRS